MSYNILSVNPGHNGAVALLVDGELVYYVEEERLSRHKYDGNPFRAINDVVSKWKVDEIVIVGTNPELPTLPWTGEDPYSALVRKYYPDVKITNLAMQHHLCHAACAFYNSGFEEALALVIDGAGTLHKLHDENGSLLIEGFETESVYTFEYPTRFNIIHRTLSNNVGVPFGNEVINFDNSVTLTKTYEAVSHYLGFGFIEAGKTMGLFPYGKEDENIPDLFLNSRGKKDYFIPSYPAGAFIDQSKLTYLRQTEDPKKWHRDQSKLTDAAKNLAWKIQTQTQELVGDLVEKYVDQTGITNIVIAGGYGLNCVANYYLAKRFPHLDFYFEPIAHDGGTTIGAAKLIWHERGEEPEDRDMTIRPQKTLYHGPEYDNQTIIDALDKNADKIKTSSVNYKDVANLIADGNIVALFQGRSEAGPRALGNRSILYDPRDPNGKDFVNVVKGREWFRPFAGTVLKEDAVEWFDLAGFDESPFMMMAVNIVADKVDKIPAVAHVDNTCRVQTVSEQQNKHYYNLIKSFKEITGVPVLFNTSFNLAGDPLVETIDDAIDTISKSKIKYLYLPELELLVTKLEE